MDGPFSKAEIDQFQTDGLVMLRGGFSREIAAECREFVWREVLSWRNCSTDGQPMVHVQRSFSGEPFDGIIGDRLRVAIDQVAGVGRAIVHESFGWWPVLFPGFPGPGGWHVDGSNFHHLTSREQGLVTLFLFSGIGPGDGGTPVARGSHHAVARLLAAAEPPGLSLAELQAKLPPADPAGILEVTGEAGDVAMLIRSKIRCSSIADGMYSPVEDAIRTALAR
jgi:hypothetical protein